jgi:hypothetical protein
MAAKKKGGAAAGKGAKPKAKKQMKDLDTKDDKSVKGGILRRRLTSEK